MAVQFGISSMHNTNHHNFQITTQFAKFLRRDIWPINNISTFVGEINSHLACSPISCDHRHIQIRLGEDNTTSQYVVIIGYLDINIMILSNSE